MSAYRGLREFKHLTINHSLNFVDSADPLIHIQNVEGFWTRNKCFCGEMGCEPRTQSSNLMDFFGIFQLRNTKG